jgi:hypothetical protein
MSVKNLQKVIEPLAVTDKATIVVEKAPEGKLRVTSSAWSSEKVILKDEVLEVRNVEGRLHVVPQTHHHDEWDLPIPLLSRMGRASVLTKLPGGNRLQPDKRLQTVIDYMLLPVVV